MNETDVIDFYRSLFSAARLGRPTLDALLGVAGHNMQRQLISRIKPPLAVGAQTPVL